MKIANELDGDLPVQGAECPYFVRPVHQPGNLSPAEWQYGCASERHPRHIPDGYAPLAVECDGILAQCECQKRPFDLLAAEAKIAKLTEAGNAMYEWIAEGCGTSGMKCAQDYEEPLAGWRAARDVGPSTDSHVS